MQSMLSAYFHPLGGGVAEACLLLGNLEDADNCYAFMLSTALHHTELKARLRSTVDHTTIAILVQG